MMEEEGLITPGLESLLFQPGPQNVWENPLVPITPIQLQEPREQELILAKELALMAAIKPGIL